MREGEGLEAIPNYLMVVCSMMHQERERVKADPGLSSVFIDPTTGHIWNEVILYIKKNYK